MTDLRERFDRDLADLLPPRDLETAVLSRGRRLRARRRAGQAAGTLVTAAAGTALVLSLLGGSGGTTAEPGFADDPPPAASPTPVTEEGPTGWWDMPARRMLATLKDALPEGVSVAEADLTADGENGPIKAIGSLTGVLDAESGPGRFQILLYPPQPAPAVAADQGGETPFTQRVQCRQYMTTCKPLLDDDGIPVGRIATDSDQGTTYYDVFLRGPDGGAIYAYVADSSGEKPGYELPSATEPPLTVEELVALARDAAWTSYSPAG